MLPCLNPDDEIAERFEAARAFTRTLFSLVDAGAFDARPIPLRHPLRFYEGHLAAFNLNTLRSVGLLERLPDERLCALFARGIDPEDEAAAAGVAVQAWPPRDAVAGFIDRADEIVAARMREARRPDVLLTCIEHEEMHQETLLYLIHQLPPDLKSPPPEYAPAIDGAAPPRTWIEIEGGRVSLGAPADQAFGWDNEYPAWETEVGAFEIASHKITNADVLAFMAEGGYANAALWSDEGWRDLQAHGRRHPPFWLPRDGGFGLRAAFADIDLPPHWPALLTCYEAEAVCRWMGGRLPTEAEFHRAAFADGDLPAGCRQTRTRFALWDLHPVAAAGVAPDARGVSELVGNGWEWTSTVFAGFAGFHPRSYYPGYSADFFDGAHNVLKGAAPITPAGLVRPSFRNWFRRGYRWAYTTARPVRGGHA